MQINYLSPDRCAHVRRMVSVFIGLVLSYSSLAQSVTIYTPNGTAVTVVNQSEFSQAQINAINAQAALEYPSALVIGDASNTYNCHAYAWYLTECAGCTRYWMNSPEDDKYWNDNSYIEVPSCIGSKVSYASDDHSAVVSWVSGKFDSKWGQYPVMRHDPTYTPYNSSNLKYYIRRPSIAGSSPVCSSGTTFTINNLPSGATITWSASPSYLFSQSSGTLSAGSTSVTLNAQSNSSGQAVLTISIQGSCGSPVQIQSNAFWVGTPLFLVSGPALVTSGSYNTYSIAPWNQQVSLALEGVNPNQTIWSFPWGPTNSGWGGGGTGASVGVVAGPQSTIVRAEVANSCGNGIRDYEVFVQQVNCPPGGCEEPFIVYPNPSSDELVLTSGSVSVEKVTNVALQDANGTTVYSMQATGETQIKIPVREFKSGTYYLSINENGVTKKRQIVIHH